MTPTQKDAPVSAVQRVVHCREEKAGHPLYANLKGRAYELAITVAGRTNTEAQTAGFRDAFDLIMRDSDHPRQQTFLRLIPGILSEAQRRILLDGMAREYAGCADWLTYVDREGGGE